MRFPVSVKGVVEINGRVPLLRNERSEWELPGGRLDLGEDLEATAEREVLEELGISVQCRALVDAWTYCPAGGAATVVIVVFDRVPRTPLAATRSLTWSSEHSEARWFDVASLANVEMPEPYKRSIARAARSRRDESHQPAAGGAATAAMLATITSAIPRSSARSSRWPRSSRPASPATAGSSPSRML